MISWRNANKHSPNNTNPSLPHDERGFFKGEFDPKKNVFCFLSQL